MHSIFGRPVLSFDAAGRALPGTCPPMLGRFVQVYCHGDDIPIFSKTPARAEHLVHVWMVLETLRHHKLYASQSEHGHAGNSISSSESESTTVTGKRRFKFRSLLV